MPSDKGSRGSQLEGRPSAGVEVRLASRAHEGFGWAIGIDELSSLCQMANGESMGA